MKRKQMNRIAALMAVVVAMSCGTTAMAEDAAVETKDPDAANVTVGEWIPLDHAPTEEELEAAYQETLERRKSEALDRQVIRFPGKCGDSMSYTLENGTLTLSGSGTMDAYTEVYPAPWKEQLSEIKSLVVEEGVEGISNNAFKDASALESVSFPSTLKTIGNAAFRNCIALKEVALPEGLTQMGKAVFRGCTSLTKVTLPASLSVVSDSAFQDCTALEACELPEGIQALASRAFNSSGLKTVSLPTSVTELGNYVFKDCAALESIDLPRGLLTMGYGCFSGCTSLRSASLPGTLAYVPVETFRGCTALEEASFGMGVKVLDENIFLDSLSMTSLTIPASVEEIDVDFLDNLYFTDESPLTIYTYEDSTAHDFVKAFELKYELIG